MTLTTGQRTNFFTADVQMGLTGEQRTALSNEGLVLETDFQDFQDEEFKIAFRNVRSGVPGVPGVATIAERIDNATGNVLVAAVPFAAAIPAIRATPIPAKCAYRLLTTSIAYNYYVDTDRAISQNNMHFQNTLRGFKTEWSAIVTTSKQSPLRVPAISKTNPPLRW